MNDLAKENSMSLNYKINNQICSFKSEIELLDHLNLTITALKEPLLMVESLDPKIGSYDHMDEIIGLSYKAVSCLKGIEAMASCIQESGNFNEYKDHDIVSLAIRCGEILDEISAVADAAGPVYESNRRAEKGKSELVVASA